MLSTKETIWWTVFAVAVPSALAMVWWCMEKGFNSVAPFQVRHLRPKITDRYASADLNLARAGIYS